MSSTSSSRISSISPDRHIIQVKQQRNLPHSNASENHTCVPQTDGRRHQSTKICTPDNVIRTALDPCMMGGMGLGCAGGWA